MSKIINRDSDLKVINKFLEKPLFANIIQHIETIELAELFHNHIIIYLRETTMIKSNLMFTSNVKFRGLKIKDNKVYFNIISDEYSVMIVMPLSNKFISDIEVYNGEVNE